MMQEFTLILFAVKTSYNWYGEIMLCGHATGALDFFILDIYDILIKLIEEKNEFTTNSRKLF